jgi:hypothetical protein
MSFFIYLFAGLVFCASIVLLNELPGTSDGVYLTNSQWLVLGCGFFGFVFFVIMARIVAMLEVIAKAIERQ